jgi:hypothetical protein
VTSVATACTQALRKRLSAVGKIQATSVIVSVIFGSADASSGASTMSTAADTERDGNNQTDGEAYVLSSHAARGAKASKRTSGLSCFDVAQALLVTAEQLVAEGTLDTDLAWPLLRVLMSAASEPGALRAAATLLAAAPASHDHVRALHKHTLASPGWLHAAPAAVQDALRGFLPRNAGACRMARAVRCVPLCNRPQRADVHAPMYHGGLVV